MANAKVLNIPSIKDRFVNVTQKTVRQTGVGPAKHTIRHTHTHKINIL